MSLNSLSLDGLSILNAKPTIIPGQVFLHDLVAQTSTDCLAAAVDFLLENGQRIVLSYSELHAASSALANKIACQLRSEARSAATSETPGSFVLPILSHQSPQLYIAILAALKVGGAFCPLNIDIPPNRVRFILEDVRAKVVLVSRTLASKIPVDSNNYKVIYIDDVLSGPETRCDNFISPRELKPEDIAYVMYTSGSTGTPKGVAVSHLAATQSILAHERHLPPFSRFLQFAAPTFDVSIFEIFFPLFRGATLVGCNRAEMLIDLPGVLKKMEVDACELTPSVAGSLLRQRSRAPGLRLLLTIGEMLTEPVIREFGGDENKSSMLWGMYGPTEASIHCTVQTAFAATAERSTIGIPLDTVSVFVIRIPVAQGIASQFEILPLGETGELALGGVQLATCYLNRADQTAASFLSTPWGRVYRTGDKARIRPDGTVECLGRIDDSQIKLNGQRLELGEIEQVLLRVPGCHGAFATVISNVLVAFVATEQVMSDLNAQFWDQCRSWLPAFMVPTDIIVMEQLPQLPSGKVDRKRLINDFVTRTTNASQSVDAIDDSERLLCEAATAVLGAKIDPLTEFSVARLDSLAAIEYASILRERGISVTPIDILSTKSPRELRQRIESMEPLPGFIDTGYQSTYRPPLKPYLDITKLKATLGDRFHDVERVERSTPLQQSMIAETLKDSDLYINQVEFELASNVTLDSLQLSLKTLAECNEILRTGFAFVEGELCQVIWTRLDDAQLYDDMDGKKPPAGEVEDVELFLLHPLKIGIQRPKLAEKPYTLLLTLHHAIYDGWTVDLMIEDLSLLLSGQLPVNRPQFSQIVRYLQDNPEDPTIDSMEFWTDHLRGFGPVSSNFQSVAVSKPQRAVSVTKISLQPGVLRDFMLHVSVGPQVLFQACVVWLWTAVQGVEDVAIGCVSSGRTLPLAGIEKIMGPCMATLPLRINISRYRTILELLQGIHSNNREILRHGHIPLLEIHKISSIPTNSRLFDVIFSYQETLASRRRKSNIVQESWHREATEAKLVVEIQPCEDHFICQMTSRTDVLSQPLLQAFTRHLICLIDHFSNHFEAPVESISQCFSFDNLSHYNDNPRSIDIYPTLSEMVENSASRFSSAVALRFAISTTHAGIKSESLSYHELNMKANQIARHLRQCAPACHGVIAIIMNKSPLLYCSILGILKAGCAYLPILPNTPLERVKVILDQAEPCLCVVDAMSSSLISRGILNVINIETAVLSSYSCANLNIRGLPSDLAYVIYTSGTTGTPKGVSVTNKNILSNIGILSDIYPHESSNRMLQACSQAFDVSVFEIFFTWANGMCLCAATNDTLFENFEEMVRSLKITHLSLTVTVASLLDPESVPMVQFLVASGEPMTDEVLKKWSQHLYQGYGPSETTNICTVRKVSRGDSLHFLGWSLENTSTFVLHPKSTQLVPVGCTGELCFGGDQVASGYMKLPEATAGRFIDHPNYGRLYRSGDLGRMLPDGSLIIHGRIDRQVKFRGLRVELQEIEATALKTGLTRTCKSVLVTHESTKLQQLAFFYVPFDYEATKFKMLSLGDRFEEQVQALYHAFRACLPEYMVPTFIFPISTLPMTSSGKVDEGTLRRTVEELSVTILSTHSSVLVKDRIDEQSDWSETEILIANVIVDQLKYPEKNISRWTTFAALGLDSISAMPVARKLQLVLQKRVPLSLLLQNPSVSRLASVIDKQQSLARPAYSPSSLLPEIIAQEIRESFTLKGRLVANVLPCTPLQQAMVVSSSLNSPPTTTLHGVTYFNQMLFHLRVPYETMVSLWNEVIRRHEILRACFTTSDNIRYPVIQVILDQFIPNWQILEIETASLLDRASQHLISVSTATNSHEPPIALAVFRTNGSGDYLSFVCHHAMYDGISMRIILSEIEALYHCRQLPEPLSLEPILREMLLPSPNQGDFWKKLFHRFQPTTFMCENFEEDSMPRSLPLKASTMSLEFIEFRLQELGVSMLALIQASWAITLSVLCGTSDVSFGNVVNGRSIPLDMIDRLVAPCFNTLPVRMDLSFFPFLLDIMKRFQSLNAEMMLHQFTSLRSIQSLVETQMSLFDSLVILQPPKAPLDDSLWSLVYENGLMDIPLVCEVIPSGLQETLAIQLHRDRSKLSYQTLQLIGKIFSHTINTCLQYPSSHLPSRETLPVDWRWDIEQLISRQDLSSSQNNSPGLLPDSGETWSPSELVVRRTLAKLVEMPEDQIDRLTSIYHYGLDSITAIQLAILLRQKEIFVSATDIIGHPTCAGIASAMNHVAPEDSFGTYDFESFCRHIEGEITQCGTDPQTLEAVLPCTSAQQGILSQFLDSNGRHYFNYSSWELDLAATPDSIVQAWLQLVDHHQILRTGFVPISHPDSSFAMLVHHRNRFKPSITTHRSDTFDDEKWFSDGAVNALHTLARPPWRIAIVTPGLADSTAFSTIHLAIHHALYDAYTLRILLQDLELILCGHTPKGSSLHPAVSQYFGLVRSSQLAGETFWTQKADDFVSHRFPVMTPLRVANSNFLTVSHACDVESSKLRRAASKVGITMQAALQAAWVRLLSAYIGESRVIFGVVLDGRATYLARESTLPMILTVPVVAENVTSNTMLLQQMMQYNSDLRRCQFMPITQIRRCLGITGSMFDTILLYQAVDRTMKPPPIRIMKELSSVEYPISLEVEESYSDATQLNLTFNSSILPKEQATLLLRQFEAMLTDLLFSVGTTASHLDIKNPDLYSMLPANCESLPTEKFLLHELVEHSSQVIPSAPALEFADGMNQFSNPRRWTYQELDALGNQVAHFIISHGVRVGQIVATCFDKCPIAYFTILGILKAGCAFLCLDPSSPATRQTFILEDSEATMVLLGKDYDWAQESSSPAHIIDENMLVSLPTSRPSLQRQVSPSDSCYCLYTSGTTGTPKGCLMSHENAVQAMAAFKHLFSRRWNQNSRWLQFAAFHFDVSVLEQYWSWYVGITVVAAPKDVILSDLAMTISRLGITHIDLTPSLARLIHPDECPSLCEGVFITGGEKLRSDILDTWGPKRVIYNAYGPTETTIGITMQRAVPQNGKPSNIGNLFPNVGAYIFERNSETPVLRGGIGELCVSGKLVGKGYLNREKLTRERFSVLQASGERVYRTGDLVRVLHDNSLDFLGRADDQVKLRGQRLEFGEINHVIRESLDDKTGDVTTIVTRRKAQETDMLVSFVALSSDSTSTGDLQIFYDANHIEFARHTQEACKAHLATYMVPTFILCITRIPLSTNNKIDVNSLKKLFSELSNEQVQTLSALSVEDHRPLNRLENEVLEAVCQVVQVQENDISPMTTIYQLGVDSITAARVAKQLRTNGFSSATASLILQNPAIGPLTRALSRLKAGIRVGHSLQVEQSLKALRHQYIGSACEDLEVNASEVEYIAPCTPLQQGMIARSKSRGAQHAYFNQFHLHLDSDVSVDRLKVALSRVIASHSILRTAFVETPDGFLQVAIKARSLRLFEMEADTESFELMIAERKQQWIEANYHILKWPVEVDYINKSGNYHLLLRLFHGVYDAHSLGLLLGSLRAEYDGLPCLSGPSFISVLLQGPLHDHRESHQFWKSLLKNHRFQPMPSLIDRPCSITTDSSVITRSVILEGLENRRKALQVTHQTLLQAAWLHTLRRYFVNSPTIGVVLSGRSLAVDDIDLVVGPLFNTLPLRADLTSDMSWNSQVRKIQECNNGLLSFMHTPLRDIQKLCADGQPLFDTLFTFDREYGDTLSKKGPLWSIQDNPVRPDYPLAIEIVLTGNDTLRIILVAQEVIADNPALNSLLGQFTESLKSIIATPDEVPPLSVAEAFHIEMNKNLPILSPEPNSEVSHRTLPRTAFEWKEEAYDVQRELAALSGVGEKDISKSTNLFALGLDSIDMIKLTGRLTRLGYHVSVSTLMKQPTFENVVTSLKKAPPPAESSPSTTKLDHVISILEDYNAQADIKISDIEAILPPTPLQDSMVADMVRSDFHTYFNHDVLEFSSDIDINQLKSAFSRVYAGSPILRTTFFEVDDPRISSAYYQVIRNNELKIPPTLQISSMDDIPVLTDTIRLQALEGRGTSKLFQVHFVELGTRNFVILSIAHALYDGWSLHMLHRDIQAAYEGNYMPRQSYSPYLSRLLILSNTSSQQFWTELLHEAHVTLLPEQRTTPKDGTVYRVEKSSTRSVANIRALCKHRHITPQVLGQACWAAVLASLIKSIDIVFGVVLSGRDTEQAQGLMFPTMNTVPLRLALHGTVAEFLEYCQRIMSSVVEFQHTPLRNIQKLAQMDGTRLFNTLFLLQNVGDNNTDGRILRSRHSVSAVDYPVCVELELTGSHAVWRIASDKNYMSLQDVEMLATSLEKVLDFFAESLHSQVLRFSSSDSSTVSICGLAPIVFSTAMQSHERVEAANERVSNHEFSHLEEYETLLDVLSDLSQVSRYEINPDLSIFHLGLDSISAIKASSMLRKRGLEISTRDLVTMPSIHAIMDKAHLNTNENPEYFSTNQLRSDSVIDGKEICLLVQRSKLDEKSIETILPCLPMQMHMLTVWQNSGGTVFFPKFVFKVLGSINLAKISRAWTTLVDEVAMLRTHLITTTSFSPPFLQIILKPSFAREGATRVASESHGRWEFTYAATPFAVVHFLGEQPGEANFNLYLHHALYDAISLPGMLNRFTELCSSGAQPAAAPAQQIPWFEFVSRHLSPPIQVQRQKFWTSYLSGNTSSQLYGPPEHTTAGSSQRVNEFQRTSIHNMAVIKSSSSAQGISAQAFLLAAYAKAFAKLLYRETDTDGKADCVFGIYLANRYGCPDIEAVPFPTLNIVPLRVKAPLSQTLASIASNIQTDIAEISMFKNSTVSLWEIQEWTGVRIDTFVNILPRPHDSLPPGPTAVTLEKLPNVESPTEERSDITRCLITPSSTSLCPNAIAQSYVEGVDIEMALHDDMVELGVFGPSSIIAASQAKEMVTAILTEIEAVEIVPAV
ncbi:putative non-ribosomal peptide synthetase [Xylaria nigripes]|nr:putative non-ribosomal peptide synthetase [Xylaria nigripes]